MDDKNKTIAIGKNKDPYEMPLNLLQISIYLEYLGFNSKRELNEIFRKMNLDSSSRIKYDNTIDFKSDENERRKLRNINKGLTMELFASGMFGYIDHPSEVHSNCLVSRSRTKDIVDGKEHRIVPCHFAQGGVPDVQVDYENFMVILEVSAKYQPSLEDYKKQLNGALKHARSIRENGYEKSVYCILINERTLNHVVNKEALKKVLEDINPSEQIYITAMSNDELAGMGKTMVRIYESDMTKITSDDLHSVLKATVEKGIYGKFHEKFIKHLDDIAKVISIWF